MEEKKKKYRERFSRIAEFDEKLTVKVVMYCKKTDKKWKKGEKKDQFIDNITKKSKKRPQKEKKW